MKIAKKGLCLLISVLMLISTLPVIGFASDYEDHWAKDSINLLLSQGVISGYTDGTVKPSANILRAEFVTVVNKYFGYKAAVNGNFKDIDASKWYANDFAIAKTQGYITGDDQGNANPEAYITRAEVCVIFSKILNLPLNYNLNFADNASIPDWAKGYIGAMVNNGLISGYVDGTVKATNNIQRGEAFSIVTRTNKSSSASGEVGNTSSMVVLGGAGGSGGGGNNDTGSKVATISLHHFDPSNYKIQLDSKNSSSIEMKIVAGNNLLTNSFVLDTTLVGGKYLADISEKISEMVVERIGAAGFENANNEKYTISAKANGKSGYDDSDWKKLTTVTVKYGRVADAEPLHEMFKDERKVVVSWPLSADATAYEVKVYNELDVDITETENVSLDLANGKVTISNIANLFADKYKLEIVSKGSGLSFDSDSYGHGAKVYNVDLGLLPGSGTESDPYIVKYAEQFALVANAPHAADANYMVIDDITVNSASMITTTFTGTFKGAKNYDASVAPVITLALTDGDMPGFAAMFTTLGSGAKVSNFVFKGSVSVETPGGYAAAIAASATNAVIENCVNNANVISAGSYVGGFVGKAERTTIKKSSNTGKIVGAGLVGGFAGELSGEVSESYNLGTVYADGDFAGGIVGALRGLSGKILNCYNAGKVSGTKAAGIVYEIATTTEIDVQNNYNIGESANIAPVFGTTIDHARRNVKNNYYSDIVARSTSVNAVIENAGATAAQPIKLSVKDMTAIDSYAGFASDIWQISKESGYIFAQLKNNAHAYGIETLAPVDNLAVNGTTVSFGSVENAQKYLMLVYSVNGDLAETVEGTATEIASAGLIFNEDYYIYIVALASGKTSANYAEKVYTNAAGVTRPIPVTTVAATYQFVDSVGATDENDEENLVITWDAAAGAEAYKVTLKNALGAVLYEYDDILATTHTVEFGGLPLLSQTDKTLTYEVQAKIGDYHSLAKSGSYNIEFGGGEGTVLNPYIIYSKRHYMNLVNNNEALKEFHFKQCADIYTQITEPIPALRGSYIGDVSDGSTHRVLTVNVNKSGVWGTAGMIVNGSGVELRNIRLKGTVTLTGPTGTANIRENSDYTYAALGGFIAAAGGGSAYAVTIDNCINEADIYLYSSGTTLGGIGPSGVKSNGVGGIIGSTYSLGTINITNCINTGDIRTAASRVGGIHGHASVTSFVNCANYGYVQGASSVGGISGDLTGANFIRCANGGEIYATSDGAGGIIGCPSSGSPIISECLNEGLVRIGAANYVGGLIGKAHSSAGHIQIADCINKGNVTSSNSNAKRGSMAGGMSRPSSTTDTTKRLSIYNTISFINMQPISSSITSPLGVYYNKEGDVGIPHSNYYRTPEITTYDGGGIAVDDEGLKAILSTDSSFDSSIWGSDASGYPMLKNAPDKATLNSLYDLGLSL